MPQNSSRIQMHHQSEKTALSQLHEFSITGNSEAMRQQMLEDTFVLKDIAIFGQWTTIYAAQYRTLLTLWLLKEALDEIKVDGHYVFV